MLLPPPTELESLSQKEQERRHKATASLTQRLRQLSTSLPHAGLNPWNLAALQAAAQPDGLFGGGPDDSDDDDDADQGALPPAGEDGAAPAEDASNDFGGAGSNGFDYDFPPSAAPASGPAGDAHADQHPSAHISSYEELCRLRIVRSPRRVGGGCMNGTIADPNGRTVN